MPISSEGSTANFTSNNLRLKKALLQRTVPNDDPVALFPVASSTDPMAHYQQSHIIVEDTLRVDPHHFSIATFSTTSSNDSFSSAGSRDSCTNSYPSLYSSNTSYSLSPPSQSPVYYANQLGKPSAEVHRPTPHSSSMNFPHSSQLHHQHPHHHNIHFDHHAHGHVQHTHSPARSLSGGTAANSVHSFSSMDSEDAYRRGPRRLFEKSKGAPATYLVEEKPEEYVQNSRSLRFEDGVDKHMSYNGGGSNNNTSSSLAKSFERLDFSSPDFGAREEVDLSASFTQLSAGSKTTSSVGSGATRNTSEFYTKISSNSTMHSHKSQQARGAFLSDPRLLRTEHEATASISTMTTGQREDDSDAEALGLSGLSSEFPTTTAGAVSNGGKAQAPSLAFGSFYESESRSKKRAAAARASAQRRSQSGLRRQRSLSELGGERGSVLTGSDAAGTATIGARPRRNSVDSSDSSRSSVHLELNLDLDSVIHDALVESAMQHTEEYYESGQTSTAASVDTVPHSNPYNITRIMTTSNNNNNNGGSGGGSSRADSGLSSPVAGPGERRPFRVLDDSFGEYQGPALQSITSPVNSAVASTCAAESLRSEESGRSGPRGMKGFSKLKNLAKKIGKSTPEH